VVLTVVNAGKLTPDYICGIRKAFGRLRRTRFAANWRSGMWAVETTNKSAGWHVHIHALVEASWIDGRALAAAWAKQVGQDFAIVHVSQVRGEDYLKEICKYAVKGSDVEGWTAQQLCEYVVSTSGQRLFGVFGRLHGARGEWTKWLKEVKSENQSCPECGGQKWQYYDADEWEIHLVEQEAKPPPLVHHRTSPRPVEPSQLEFSQR
jgi:hypothetical protein